MKYTKIALVASIFSSSLLGGILEVEVIRTSDWGTGFCSNVYVSNSGETKEQWDVSFDPQGIITKMWSAEYVQNSDTLLSSAWGVDWNTYVKPNERAKFGYCANKVPVAPQVGELTVSQSLKEEWDGGFCNRVTVTNTTNHPIIWDIDFVVDGEIFTSWSSNYSQDSKSLNSSFSGLDWNDILKPDRTVEFGYCADEIEVPIEENTTTPPEVNNTNPRLALFDEFNVGFGGPYAIPFVGDETSNDDKIWMSSVNLVLDENIENSDYYSNIKDFDASAFDKLQDSLKNSKFLVYWITEGWDESWFNLTKIQKAMDAGYVPVFNYWYFGDNLHSIPTTQEQETYHADNQRVAVMLNKLQGTKFLILEPEFNKSEIIDSESTQHEFASILGNAIDTIKVDTTNTYFSLAMTDKGSRGVNNTSEKCGYEMCALGDKHAWEKPSIIYNDLLDKLDFISFQEMVAQFSRDYASTEDTDKRIARALTDDESGIAYLPQRIANFTSYLKEKYNKPVFLPYISMATASWSDSNNNNTVEESEINYKGWETQVNSAYRDLALIKNELQENGLFGFAVMSLFDNPQHDEGGYQYFLQNEYHLGILSTGATDSGSIAAHGDIQEKGDIVNNIFGIN